MCEYASIFYMCIYIYIYMYGHLLCKYALLCAAVQTLHFGATICRHLYFAKVFKINFSTFRLQSSLESA